MTAEITQSRGDVKLAFMELSSPSMEEVILELAATGASRFAVLPLFLAKGRHLKVDIPKKIEHLEASHNLTIRLLPPIGESPKLAGAMMEIVSDAVKAP